MSEKKSGKTIFKVIKLIFKITKEVKEIKISNVTKNIMKACLEFFFNVYIESIKEQKKIEIKSKIISDIIKNDLKDIFIDYKTKYKDKKDISNQNEKIDKLFNLKFIDLLKFTKKFPFENNDTSINLNEIDENIKNIINEESKNIKIKNKAKIYLDKLKPKENVIRHKIISTNNNYKQKLDYGDYILFNQFLDENCYEILNIYFFQDILVTYKKYYECIIIKSSPSKLFLIPKNLLISRKIIFNKLKIYITNKNKNKLPQNESPSYLNKKKKTDLNSTTEEEKKEIDNDNNNYDNSDNCDIFNNNNNNNYGEKENKDNTFNNNFINFNEDNISTRDQTQDDKIEEYEDNFSIRNKMQDYEIEESDYEIEENEDNNSTKYIIIDENFEEYIYCIRNKIILNEKFEENEDINSTINKMKKNEIEEIIKKNFFKKN